MVVICRSAPLLACTRTLNYQTKPTTTTTRLRGYPKITLTGAPLPKPTRNTETCDNPQRLLCRQAAVNDSTAHSIATFLRGDKSFHGKRLWVPLLPLGLQSVFSTRPSSFKMRRSKGMNKMEIISDRQLPTKPHTCRNNNTSSNNSNT